MIKRLITGICYVAVLVGFFFLRYVDHRLFGILIYAFSLFGTYEMLHAFSHGRENGASLPQTGVENGAVKAQEHTKTDAAKAQTGEETNAAKVQTGAQVASAAPSSTLSLSQKIAVWVFAGVFTPLFYLCEWLEDGSGYRGALIFSFAFAVVLLCLLVIDFRHTTLAGTGASLLCGIYPTAILATMMLANELHTASTLALLLIFVISPVADTFAYLTGSLFKGKKLCPSISPHKTVSGAVGGVVFGTAASVLLYWLYTVCTGYEYAGVGAAWAGTSWVLFVVLGLVTSLLTEFGDLVESVIKRRLGVKDMGRLLPGHGGVLDRIDGTLFASMIVYILFALLITPVATA